MSSARKGDDTDEDEEKKRFCRYCFEDDAQERLIAPCTYFLFPMHISYLFNPCVSSLSTQLYIHTFTQAMMHTYVDRLQVVAETRNTLIFRVGDEGTNGIGESTCTSFILDRRRDTKYVECVKVNSLVNCRRTTIFSSPLREKKSETRFDPCPSSVLRPYSTECVKCTFEKRHSERKGGLIGSSRRI